MTEFDDTQFGGKVNATSLTQSEMRAAVRRVSDSHTLSTSPKLKDFLSFVVEETIQGRQDGLLAKTIALHVYKRDADDPTSANVVRVEAGRLRRLLEDYYEDEGAADDTRIHIDKGGYAPRFERRIKTDETLDAQASTEAWPRRSSFSVRTLPLAILALICIAVTALYVLWPREPRSLSNSDKTRLEREALMEQSPAALEAANLTDQARGLIWPIFDFERQRLTTELFRTAIVADPNAAGAYAGAAQTLASLALLSLSGPQHDAFLAEAQQMAEQALAIAPSDAWSQSAAGWVRFVAGDHDEAMRLSERAVSLAPNDGNVLDFYGVVAILSGKPDLGLTAGNRERRRTGPNTRFAYLNILGAAYFHTGDFEAAAAAFEEGNSGGGPLSAPGIIYLAATRQALGQSDEGKRLLALLEESWPQFPVEAVLLRLHKEEAAANEVLDRLRSLGWTGRAE
ncbi:tetratricopeptide repeat protein [Ruegeria lacuscaerulensis]|uniref:tetratricopeptide repeat protein n=1 Tax=Ruegeria lacuscaerulensis TaxID=55218 RepID=UPI00147B1431|nr:hypothetical protein [Ruegeria lacuscaerulensis]